MSHLEVSEIIEEAIEATASGASSIASSATKAIVESTTSALSAVSDNPSHISARSIYSSSNSSSILSRYPALESLAFKFNEDLSKFTSFTWLWDRLPFPPILFTYGVIVVSATFVVTVACIAAANKKPRNAGSPDPKSKYYHPVDTSISNQTDLAEKVKANLVKKLVKGQALAKEIAKDPQQIVETEFATPDTYLSRFETNLLKLKKYREISVGASEAWLMPVFGAFGLCGLYFSYKYFNAANIQTALSVYFSFMSFGSTATTLGMLIKYLTRKISPKTTIPHWRITLANDNELNSTGFEPGFDKLEKEFEEEQKKKREKKRLEKAKKAKKAEKIEKPEKKTFKRKPAAKDMDICTPVEPKEQYLNFYFSFADLIGFPVSGALVALRYYTENWVFGNILAMCVAIRSIVDLPIESFKTGLIMLGGLFAYDIFFVFGTNIMVTVATKVQIPIKLEIPRPYSASELAMVTPEMLQHIRATAMLGLGDIVVPALYIALCRRFDQYMYYEKHTQIVEEVQDKTDEDSLIEVKKIQLPYHIDRPYPKPYFNAGIIAYVVGLVVTVGVMHVFKAGQPALLYLCPAIAASTLITAYSRGELKQLFAFKDGDHEDGKDEDEDEDDIEEEDAEVIEIKIESDDENEVIEIKIESEDEN